MKKFFVTALIFCILAGVLATLVSAEDAELSLDDFMIVHYDFEGDDFDTQLADKADAGKSQENINTYNTVEGYDDLTVENGVAHIKSHENPAAATGGFPYVSNGFTCKFKTYEDGAETSDTDTGADIIKNTTGEYTYYISFRVVGDGLTAGGFRDLFRLSETPSSHLFRVYSGNCNLTNHTKDYSFVSGALSAVTVATLPYNGDTFVHFAVTMSYDEAAQKWNYNAYLSVDEGKTYYLVLETSAANPKDYYSSATMLSFGNFNVNGCPEYYIDDFRVYNRALTDKELVSINYEMPEDGGDSGDTQEEETTDPSSTTKAPTGTSQPDDDTNSDSDTPESTATGDEPKKGCASSVSGILFGWVISAASLGLVSKKKKH